MNQEGDGGDGGDAIKVNQPRLHNNLLGNLAQERRGFRWGRHKRLLAPTSCHQSLKNHSYNIYQRIPKGRRSSQPQGRFLPARVSRIREGAPTYRKYLPPFLLLLRRNLQ